MNDPTSFLDIIFGKLAGLIGALCSLKYIKGVWYEKVMMVTLAIVAAYNGAGYLSTKSGLPEGVSGLLIGFLGAAIADKMMETVQSNETWAAIRAKVGL